MFDINAKVHYLYWEKNLNCAKTTLICLSKIFDTEINSQIFDAAIGLSGAGQFRAQCGLVEGGLIFIGIYFSKIGLKEAEIRKICHDYAEGFQNKFGSLRCCDLRPTGFVATNPPHLCEKITCSAIDFAYCFIKQRIINTESYKNF